MFIRENRTVCENYMEVDIVPRTLTAENVASRSQRGKKQKVSRPAQDKLNDKNAKRYLLELLNGNFTDDDLMVTVTYSDKYLPSTPDAANKCARNYLRRLEYRRKKLGLDPLKYILTTEYDMDENNEYTLRVHHHIVMNGGLDRDEVENIWSQRIKGTTQYEPMGRANTRRLQADDLGYQDLTNYLTKQPKRRKRWSASRNLVTPERLPKRDFKYRPRRLEKEINTPDQGREYFEKKYPDYNIVDVTVKYYEMTGWHVYLKMWRKVGRMNR